MERIVGGRGRWGRRGRHTFSDDNSGVSLMGAILDDAAAATAVGLVQV